MRADSYPPINVLSVFRGIQSEKLPYHITPYRFEKQNGQAYKVDQIRHFHQDRKGKGQQFHYVVKTDDNQLFRLLFDTNTFTWRLVEEVKNGERKYNKIL